MKRDLYLSIDVGTGSIRSALIDRSGAILAVAAREHDQITPQVGWSEQRPRDWWQGVRATIIEVLSKIENAPTRVAAIGTCGQMHGTVLIGKDGLPTLDTAPLWNDKRTAAHVAAFNRDNPYEEYLDITANLAGAAWPGFKLQWLRDERAESYDAAETLLMPKDYINYRLTGEIGWDFTEASMSFVYDISTGNWSDEMIGKLDLRRDLFGKIRNPDQVLASLTDENAHAFGLPTGLPVIVGGGDYPVSILGTGGSAAGTASDVTGTSTILTLLNPEPIITPEASNVKTPSGQWGTLTLLDAGGDAVRWARRAFHDKRRSYGELADIAARGKGGSKNLFFLPYLAGERFGEFSNSRAQFFGLTARHDLSDLHRAVLEGVAFSVRHRLDALRPKLPQPLSTVIAAGGGAKSELWLEIKAAMYNASYQVPAELEGGLLGSAILMETALGRNSMPRAVVNMVSTAKVVDPDPKLVEKYDRMMPIYRDLYEHSQGFYARLDELDRVDSDE